MNPKVKKLWLEALRSGEYKQSKDFLRKENSFCCLGVLCELAVKNGIIDASHEVYNGYYSYDVDIKTLPINVAAWAGLESVNPITNIYSNKYKDFYNLTGLNDNGYTFTEIANEIEKEF